MRKGVKHYWPHIIFLCGLAPLISLELMPTLICDGDSSCFWLPQIFFVISVLLLCFLCVLFNADAWTAIQKSPYVLYATLMITVGVLISHEALAGLRLLTILLVLSSSVALVGYLQQRHRFIRDEPVLLLITAPFGVSVFITVLVSLWFSLTGLDPMDHVGVLVNGVGRWQALNSSPNGLGLDATIVGLATFVLFRNERRVTRKVMWGIGFIMAVYCLHLTLLRAGLLFLIVGIMTVEFLINVRRTLAMVLAGGLGVVLLLFSPFAEPILAYLRFSNDLVLLTTNRFTGAVGLVEMIWSDPFRGRGLGGTDQRIPIHPLNLFYLGLLAEVGVFGFVGIVTLMFGPVVNQIRPTLIKIKNDATTNSVFLFSCGVCVASFAYLFFEFNIFRVSALNQLFFFCWGVVLFRSKAH